MLLLYVIMYVLANNQAAKILAIYPTPSISHQIVFRPFTQELVKRGHKVTVVTANPVFDKVNTPENLIEIDVEAITYAIIRGNFSHMKIGNDVTMRDHFDGTFGLINSVGVKVLNSEIIEELSNQEYDLLILEAINKITFPLAHKMRIPTILISSFGALFDYKIVGAPSHPILYPEITSTRIKNLSIMEEIREIFVHFVVRKVMYDQEENIASLIRQSKPDTPSFDVLRDRVTALLLNVETIWEENRPVPIGLSYINGVYQWTKQVLSEDLKIFLDSSERGVIYVSFGTNVHPSLLPKDKIDLILRALSKLPHDILLKWDKDELPWKPDNVLSRKWFPQVAVLNHPNLKLFITQCGLQSTEEAIDAGVPLIGIPFMFDQWANAEKYVRHRIGLKLAIETMTEPELLHAVNSVIRDKSYRENIIRFRALTRDQPHKPLDTAIWWAEYVIRHKEAWLLRSPAANMPWTQYFELELVCVVLTAVVLGLSTAVCTLAAILKCFLVVFKRNARINVVSLKVK